MGKQHVLYVRVTDEELTMWHEWRDRRLHATLSKVVRHLFEKGRLPRSKGDPAVTHLFVASLRVSAQMRRIKNLLGQARRLQVGGYLGVNPVKLHQAEKLADELYAELQSIEAELLEI